MTNDLLQVVQKMFPNSIQQLRFTAVVVYDCEVCHGVNHPKRAHCQYCGSTPASYSETGFTVSYRESEFGLVCRSSIAARGCSRVEDRRGRKLYFRTVPADYFSY